MGIQIRPWNEYSEEERKQLFQRSESDIGEVETSVAEILKSVKERGDEALRELTLKFDRVDLSGIPLQVRDSEFEAAENSLSEEIKESLRFAIRRTLDFHRHQKPRTMEMVPLMEGLIAGEKATPIDSAGLYVPRGRGSFPSMLYMLAVPATIAGVPLLQVVSPPNPDGSVDPACLFTARELGIDRVFRIGGAQAIAALAYGTESVDSVLKVVGPGSRYVAAAKRLLSAVVDAGLPAGPSESMILADESADPYNIALDLMVEAEHGSDSCAILLTDSSVLAEKVLVHAEKLLREIPEPRHGFLNDVFARYGGIILTDSIDIAVEIVNNFAPEHLQLRTTSPFSTMEKIRNAGEILLGPHLPFSAANYSTGVNAVLPTGGWAKTYSAVSVRDFMKYSSVVYAEKPGYQAFKDHVIGIADYEGFITHGNALKLRKDI